MFSCKFDGGCYGVMLSHLHYVSATLSIDILLDTIIVLCTRRYYPCYHLLQYKIAIVTADGSRVEGPLKSNLDWSIAHMSRNCVCTMLIIISPL